MGMGLVDGVPSQKRANKSIGFKGKEGAVSEEGERLGIWKGR
jgi:hypothetical protein